MNSKTGYKTFATGEKTAIEVEYEYDDAADLADLSAASIIGWRQTGNKDAGWISADYLEEGIIERWEEEINDNLRASVADERNDDKDEARNNTEE